MKKVKYVELFYSPQGEGSLTGRLSTWCRLFSCNLSCEGFGQKDPTDKNTYILPYKTIDISNVKRIEDLPLFEYGCDTSHSWSARYKHLVLEKTAEEVANDIRALLPKGSFLHATSNQEIDHVFTGGEPMMQQDAMIEIVNTWIEQGNYPKTVTIETNGTRPATPEFVQAVEYWQSKNINVLFSVSQKLFNVSGELPKKAFKPEVIKQYRNISLFGQLKYVLNGSDAAWDELDHNVQVLRDLGVDWDIWVMPVGASYTEQTKSSSLGEIADRAVARGYHVTGRLHVILWGNDQHGR